MVVKVHVKSTLSAKHVTRQSTWRNIRRHTTVKRLTVRHVKTTSARITNVICSQLLQKKTQTKQIKKDVYNKYFFFILSVQRMKHFNANKDTLRESMVNVETVEGLDVGLISTDLIYVEHTKSVNCAYTTLLHQSQLARPVARMNKFLKVVRQRTHFVNVFFF